MPIDNPASALSEALREFGEALGRALAEGITRGVQDALSRSLDIEALTERVPRRAAEGVAGALSSRPRRGGRPRGEARACRVSGCPDAARSRGLCSRHYQQELRREKSGDAPEVERPPAAPVEARPPIVRKRPETAAADVGAANAVAPAAPAPAPAPAAPAVPGGAAAAPAGASAEEARERPTDVARRIFGGR